MKAIYVLIVLLFMQGYCSRLYQQFHSDESPDKTKRDAKAHKSSKAAIVIAEHSELAWFLNALYLQIQLSSGKIDDFDVIAGLWEVDRSAIEKLVSLKIDDLAASLTSFENIVNGFPDDVDRIADVEKITENLDSVKKITPEMRNSMRMAMGKGAVPAFFGKKFPKYNFKDNPGIASFEKSDLGDLQNTLTGISTQLNTLSDWVQSINGEQHKTIDNFVKGYKTAIEVKEKVKELQELTTLLTEIGKALENLQPLNEMKGISTLKVKSKTLSNVLIQLHEYSNRSVAPAFSSNLNLASFKKASKVPQIVNLISDEKALSSLDSYLNDIASLAKTVSPINRNSNSLMNYDLMDPLNVISRSMDGVSRIQQDWDRLNLTSFSSCNESPDLKNEMSLDELATVSTDLSGAKTTADEVLGFLVPLSKVENENFGDWLNGSEIVNIQKALNNTKNLFDSIKQPQEVVDAIGRLAAAKNNVSSIQNKIGEFSILKKEYEKGKTIQKLIPLLSTIPTLSKDLSKLKRSKSSSSTVAVTNAPKKSSNGTVHKKAKRSADEGKKFECQNPQDLLDVAISFRGLQKIDLIFQYSNLIDTVIEQGTMAEKSIDLIKNPENREKLKNTWKNFGVVKTQLKAVKENNQKLLNKITSSGQEKSLEDYGLVYSNLGSLNSSERVFLSNLRGSITLFEKPNQNLTKSLEELEKPLATDWTMTHASFKRLPKAMKRLKSDFEKFFEVESGVWAFFKDNWIFLTIGAAVVIFVIALIVLYFIFIYDSDMKKEPPVDTKGFNPSKESMRWNLSYMQFQDSRFDINQRDPETGYTKIQKAYNEGNMDKMRRLAEEDAILDAVSGPSNRSLLLEAADNHDPDTCDYLMNKGASPVIYDSLSRTIDDIEPHDAGIRPRLSKWNQDKEEIGFHDRISSIKAPRPWKILVLQKGTFPLWKRKKLPHRIKACTTWGYNGEDLNQYTTIVLPQEYSRITKTEERHVHSVLLMDDDDLLKWKLVACDACLVTVAFFEQLYEAYGNTKSIENSLREDYQYCWVLGMEYKKQVYDMSIHKVKTGIHQMQPKLLHEINITLLSTKDKKKMKKHEQWKKIIKMFGGKVVETPTVDADGTLPPYHAASPKYKLEDRFHQNRCWILKEKDSEVRDEWINDWRHCTLVDFEFLPECIVRYYLLPVSNDVVPLAYRQNGNGGGGGATVTPSIVGTPGRR
uniref:ANK_REP_REGION domain-containing protein n=1 Tax=Caenorhabditis tropicalis TaxID=1561998 RepID=A0A1I7TUE4_9PELO